MEQGGEEGEGDQGRGGAEVLGQGCEVEGGAGEGKCPQTRGGEVAGKGGGGAKRWRCFMKISRYLFSILCIHFFFLGQTTPIKNTGPNGPNIKSFCET